MRLALQRVQHVGRLGHVADGDGGGGQVGGERAEGGLADELEEALLRLWDVGHLKVRCTKGIARGPPFASLESPHAYIDSPRDALRCGSHGVSCSFRDASD